MNLLTAMSVAGTMPVLICLFLYLFQKNFYNYRFGRKLLLTAIFFFLVPIQKLKYWIPKNSIYQATAIETIQINLSPKPIFVKALDGAYIWIPRWIFIFWILWAAIVIIFVIGRMWRYINGMRIVKNCIEYTVDDPRGLVYSVIPSDTVGACTIGFFRQKILIPEHLLTDPDLLMIYRHEYRHLRNHDNLIKLLCLVIICLHWMNPMAYLLLYLYQNTAEMISDSDAVQDCTLEKTKDYARLLVNEATIRESFPVVWKNSFSANRHSSGRTVKVMKRRIGCMTKKKKQTGWMQKGMLTTLSALVVVVSAASTAMAYQPMYRSYDSQIKEDIEASDYKDGWMLSSFDEENAYEIMYCGMTKIDELDFSKGDTIFVSESGELVYLGESDASAQAACSHQNTVDGYTYTHLKGSGESCSVITYKVTKCKDCGVTLKSSRYATVNYPVCPH